MTRGGKARRKQASRAAEQLECARSRLTVAILHFAVGWALFQLQAVACVRECGGGGGGGDW